MLIVLSNLANPHLLTMPSFLRRLLNNKSDDLTGYLKSLNNEFSVKGLSETWLTDSTKNCYNMNYSFINKTRQFKNGGVGMYISNHLEFKIREDLSIYDEEIFESLFIEIHSQKTKNKIIGIVYRPPNNKYNKFEEHLTNVLGHLNKEDKDTFIIGDFTLSDYVNDFVTRMYASSFYPLITKPTQIMKNTATLIDNVSRISKVS